MSSSNSPRDEAAPSAQSSQPPSQPAGSPPAPPTVLTEKELDELAQSPPLDPEILALLGKC